MSKRVFITTVLAFAALGITACDKSNDKSNKEERMEAGRPTTPYPVPTADATPHAVTAVITITLPQQTCVQTSSDGNNNFPVLSASRKDTISWSGKVASGGQPEAIEMEFPPTLASGIYKLGTPFRIANFAPAYTISGGGAAGASTQPLAPADTAYGDFNFGYVAMTYQGTVYPCKGPINYGVHVQQ
jgi:hypothetical protein